MIGRTIRHYKITAKLGEGGMGEVYLATDTKLEREVALKFLPVTLQKDPEARERLLREAKAASKLSHPNILTIHAVERAEARDYIVMEYIDGTTLPEHVRAEKLSLSDILELAVQVGEGLQAAHERGILHRDIKPENIMVTRKGVAKITDFGLAKQAETPSLTKKGTRMGSVYYMSPEQAEGRRVDARSDIFSYGVVLYELICGQRPFVGESEAVVLYELTTSDPQPLARYCRGIQPELEQAVLKSLRKNRDERYQSVSELVADLRTVQRRLLSPQLLVPRAARRGQRPTLVSAAIAVLTLAALVVYGKVTSEREPSMIALWIRPLENSGATDRDTFVDNLGVQIVARLTNEETLSIRSGELDSSGSPDAIQDRCRALAIDYYLEGRVQWQESPSGPAHLRVTPQLVRVSDGRHVWAGVYDDSVSANDLDVQARIATSIAVALRTKLVPPQPRPLEAKPPTNP